MVKIFLKLMLDIVNNMQEHEERDYELEKIKREKLKKMLTKYGGVSEMSEEKVYEVNGNEEFESEVIKSKLPVIVDFWAEWCMPCRMIAPIFKELAKEYADKMKFVKVNVDHNQDIAMRYGIQGIPTLMVFHDGRIVERVVGALPKPALKKVIEDVLSRI